jgi:hypothetical protein
MQMLPDDPEVLQMLHEFTHESEAVDELSVQLDSAWLQCSDDAAIDA